MMASRAWHVSSAHVRPVSVVEEGWPAHMAQQLKQWTLEEVHSLPDDGNKYELIRGQLFVSPAPAPDHEVIAYRLRRLLTPYVEAQQLGIVQGPRAVARVAGSDVDPDLMVRREPQRGTRWKLWPIPILVIEILSPYTRRRDLADKRSF
jgi:Uma2 family endonuclease